MIRSVLIALDGSPSSQVALRLAIRNLKKRFAAPEGEAPVSLTGIAVLDRPTIAGPEPVPPGGGAFKRERDEQLIQQADEKTQQILQEFAATCQSESVACATIRANGHPRDAITAASRTHDLIVIGRDSNFHYPGQADDDPCQTFKLLVRDHPCPVIVTPRDEPEGSACVVAYDGSLAASRALHMFAMMEPSVADLTVHVVAVHRDRPQAEALSLIHI